MKARKVSGFSIASLLGRKDSDSEPKETSETAYKSVGTTERTVGACTEGRVKSTLSPNITCSSCLHAENKLCNEYLHSNYSSQCGKTGLNLQINDENVRKQLHVCNSELIGLGSSCASPRTLHNINETYFQFYQQHQQEVFLQQQKDLFSPYSWPLQLNTSQLSNRFHGGTDHGILLSHLRKPKRIRTAFSPAQLLRLEHAFENNHYVVGQERKDLANVLTLTETQVKVWFQNRRTKFKRMKAEDEMTKTLTRKLEENRHIGNISSHQNRNNGLQSLKQNKADRNITDYDEYEEDIDV